MNSFARMLAIVRADFLIRFRRMSTLIVFLLLSAFAYVWIPAPSTGRALIQVDGHRAIYNSGAIGLGTASLGMIFVGLFGYYVISNAIRRDVVSRCGVVAASTPMRSFEYLLGKFFGNLAFLITFLAGFMLSSMAMLIVRGEAPLEPFVFVRQYLLLASGAVFFVSGIAVLFESIPLLAGKFGDVVYFFCWIGSLGVVAGGEVGRLSWTRYFDFTGFGFMISQMRGALHTNSIAIGSSPFDPTKTPILFPGLMMTPDWFLPRLVSLGIPIGFVALAGLFFHRFDPVRTRRTSEKANRNWIGRVQTLFKPLSRRVVAILMLPVRGQSFVTAIWADAVLTITLFPLVLIALVGITVATFAAPLSAVLPICLAVLAIIISDMATRDVRAGTRAILSATPRLREQLVWWKFSSTLLLSALLFTLPILRAAISGLTTLCALLTGLFFLSASATALGLATRNAKTFIVAFLSFWYLAINDHGATPMLDFAGFNQVANARTLAFYLALSLGGLIAAELLQRVRLTRA